MILYFSSCSSIGLKLTLCTHSSLKTIKSGMASSKPSNAKDDEESDQLMIKPLGAGQEVGRSCHILEFKGKKLMLDCGIHPGMQGLDTLPYVDQVDLEEIDLLLVTHFHLDHCGALPWLLEKTVFKGKDGESTSFKHRSIKIN